MSTTNGSTARTGHGGKVVAGDIDGTRYLIARVKQWSLSLSASEAAWADSDSAGYTNRTSGRKDATGTLNGVMDKTYPQYASILFNDSSDSTNHDMVELELWEDGDEDTKNRVWFFPRALITGFELTFDMDTRDPVEWSANFAADGKFYKPGDSTDSDYSNSITLTDSFETFTESW